MRLLDRLLYVFAGAAICVGVVLLIVAEQPRTIAAGWVCLLVGVIAFFASTSDT